MQFINESATIEEAHCFLTSVKNKEAIGPLWDAARKKEKDSFFTEFFS